MKWPWSKPETQKTLSFEEFRVLVIDGPDNPRGKFGATSQVMCLQCHHEVSRHGHGQAEGCGGCACELSWIEAGKLALNVQVEWLDKETK
jgi:hypothetical protein